jgi:uncharacterized protein YciI
MSYYAVTRESGPVWADGGIFAQPGVDDHAVFMNELAAHGFMLFGGPLSGTENGRVRVLLIVDAESDAEIHRRLADDPWARAGKLVTASIEPWKILVGEERLVVQRGLRRTERLARAGDRGATE